MNNTRKKVGVALGSGSAKGFAHIGVLQVLAEKGIPIDMIAGSSMGAIIGGIYACNTDLRLLTKLIAALNQRKYFDITIRRNGGLLGGERMELLIKTLTHDKSFSELEIPFFCAATDVETGERLILKEGKLYSAIRASMSIPGVFVPVQHGAHLCVDGGVLDRVPCRPLLEAGADVVFGVDVGNRGDFSRIEKGSIRGVLDNCLNIMQWEITKERTKDAHVMICPDIKKMRGLSNGRVEEAVALGRQAAEEKLPEMLRALRENGIPLLPTNGDDDGDGELGRCRPLPGTEQPQVVLPEIDGPDDDDDGELGRCRPIP
ncbi:MAG: patatin-like phospholipase family protein [Bacillota bacterium]